MQLTVAENLLLNTLKNLVAVERKTLTQILEHLQKVQDTRLFAKLGYSSLHKYLIYELGYSESAAYRRVQALKLVKEIPESSQLIEKGELTLSNITSLQTLLKDETTQTKKEAIQQVKNQTSADAKDTLFKIVPDKEKKPKDTKKKISSTHTRVSLTLSSSTMAKLEQVKARTKKYEHDELINYLLDLALNQSKPTRKSQGSANPKVIPAEVKRIITQRANHQCEHPGCNEIHYLELDHITPIAHGGTNAEENIRLVCRAHNQLYAIQKLGISKMEKYI